MTLILNPNPYPNNNNNPIPDSNPTSNPNPPPSLKYKLLYLLISSKSFVVSFGGGSPLKVSVEEMKYLFY